MNKFVFVIFNQNDHNGNSWLSIGYLASALMTEGIDCKVVFYLQEELDCAVEFVSKEKPIAVGLPMLQYNLKTCIEFCKKLKKVSPETKIVLGNKEATCYHEYLLKEHNNCIDAISLGEGEDTLPELCHCLINRKPLYSCPGLALYIDGRVVLTEKRKLRENIDTFPFPSREYRTGLSNIYNVLGSRGCRGTCSFCEANTIYKYNTGIRNRSRTVDNILDEIEQLAARHRIIHVNFLDSTFCDNNSQASHRLTELYEGINDRKLNFQFGFNIRSEQVTQNLVDCLLRLEKVGLVSILIGLESGNKEDLLLYNKSSTIDVHVRTLQLLRDNNILSGKAGIHFETGFINFNPYTTFNRLQENINFFVTQELPLLPYDMTSRLMVSGSCHMYSKILSDGLLKESQSSPMCDPYGYCFAESDIEIVYAMYVKYLNSLGIKNYANTLAKEKIYEKYFSSDYKSSLLSLYNQYIHLASNIVYFIMDAILTNLDDRYMECIVLPQINNSKEAIWEIGRKIELYDSIMSKKLYRINQLIF